MVKQKFPGLNNMTIDEVRVMARVCKNDGCDTEKTIGVYHLYRRLSHYSAECGNDKSSPGQSKKQSNSQGCH